MLSFFYICACSSLEGDIRRLTDQAILDGLPGASVFVSNLEGTAHIQSGLAIKSPETSWDERAVFRIASNSKTFLGVVAAQMHDEGLLNLDAPLSTWLEESEIGHIQQAAHATLRQCLNHSAGIYDYMTNDDFWSKADENPSLGFTTEEALSYATGAANFPIGENWEYSNTHYLLAGLVIDKVSGMHHSASFRARIYEPLSLDSTFYDGLEEPNGTIVHGYAPWNDEAEIDTHSYNHGYGLADGGLLSTALDLGIFIKALATENPAITETVRTLMLDQAIDVGEGELYGLGLSKANDEYGTVFFHGGAHVGYTSEMFYWPETDVTLTVLVNGSDSETYDDATESLLNSIKKRAHQ